MGVQLPLINANADVSSSRDNSGSCPIFGPIEFPMKFDTVKSGWPIGYIDGSQVIISKIDTFL